MRKPKSGTQQTSQLSPELTRDRLAILLTLLALGQLVALWLVMP